MSDLNINAVFGPRYEIVINQDTLNIDSKLNLTLEKKEPLKINVGTGFNQAIQNSDTLDVAITAQEVVNAYRALGYDGFLTQPDMDSLANYAGITRVATIVGDPVRVVRTGLMTELGWTWTPNAPVFITDNGVLTQTQPLAGNPVRRIGWAISATELNLDPYPIIGV